MSGRKTLATAALLVVFLLACGSTPAQVNNSGHEPYLSGNYANALESYQDAQERAPGNGEPYYNSGNVLYRTEKYEEALQSYDQSLRHARGELRARGFFNRGNAVFQQEKYQEAVEAYREVLRMNPGDQDAKHNLELALSRIIPPVQREQQTTEQDQQDNQHEQQERDEENGSQEERKDQEREQEEEMGRNGQQPESGQQDQPMTAAQARRILESVGRASQTLQERRGQVVVSPNPPSEFDW